MLTFGRKIGLREDNEFNSLKPISKPLTEQPLSPQAPVGNALATPALTAAEVEGGWYSPEAAPETTPEAVPTPTTGAGVKPAWLNPFIAAAGTMAQHFAQTPGQLSAGRMLTAHGMHQMEAYKADAAAKLAGFQSEAHMKAEQAKANLLETGAKTKLHEAEATKSMKTVELMALQGEKYGWDIKKVKRDFETGTPVEFQMGDGRSVLMEPETGYKLRLEVDKANALIKRYMTENKLTEAQVAQMFDTTEFMGMQLPKTKVAEWKTELQKTGIMAQASLQGHEISAMASKYATDMHLKGVQYTADAAKEKVGEKGIESIRTGLREGDKLIGAYSSQFFRKDEKTGKLILQATAVPFMEERAIMAATLKRDATTELDRNYGSSILNQLHASGFISPNTYKMLNEGTIPNSAPAATTPPTNTPPKIPNVKPYSWTTPGASLGSPINTATPTIDQVRSAARDLAAKESTVAFPPPALRQPLPANPSYLDALRERRF